MTEENNVTPIGGEEPSEPTSHEPEAQAGLAISESQKDAFRAIWDGLEVDVRYTAREPSARAAVTLGGVIAAGGKSRSLLTAMVDDDEEKGLNLGLFFLAAMDDPKTQDGVYWTIAELWDRDVSTSEIEEPIDDWEYDLSEKQKKEGLPSREDRWRMYSRKNRKRMLKRYEAEEMPFVKLFSLAKSLTEREIADFLALVWSVVSKELGSSSTDSSADTPSGATSE